MNPDNWCREEVLRARRGAGVGEVLPLGRKAEAGSLAFLALVLLLLLGLALRAPAGAFFTGVVTPPDSPAARVRSIALEARCAPAAALLLAGSRLEFRPRSAFGAWRQATVRSGPACTGGGGVVSLQLEAGSRELAAGTGVLLRVPRPRLSIYARLGELFHAEAPFPKRDR